MNKFSGIDLHSNNSVVVVSDDADRVVYQRRLPNDPVQIRAALAPHREDRVGVVIEATYNWYWLVDQLMNDGYRVHLANPAAIRQYEGLKYSGDFTDAAHLAQLLRLARCRALVRFSQLRSCWKPGPFPVSPRLAISVRTAAA
ncbi:hypothetical protein AWB75_05097 [Caballeronia catudaia]|uniref:Transposase IS110-like N-terminal domain-containing protein n=1 Tax=Caballeronia catudaia TaxID=1777136 RepID=A0A158CIN3_9BURK|nr:hypothetical protein AWB75_05097 [Caballeronia catudaia]